MSRDRKIADALESAVARTFSEMAFLDTVPAGPCRVGPVDRSFAIQVWAAETHRLVLDLPLPAMRTIVENIHALDWDELSASDVDDCLLEFLNVLAGTFGRLYWGDSSRYRLSLPEIRPGSNTEPDAHPATTFWFDAQGEQLAVHVQ